MRLCHCTSQAVPLPSFLGAHQGPRLSIRDAAGAEGQPCSPGAVVIVHMHVCMSESTRVCAYVCIHVECTGLRMCAHARVSVYAPVRIHLRVYIRVSAHIWCMYRHRYVVWVCSCLWLCGVSVGTCAGVVGVCVRAHVYMWVLCISNLA